MRVNVDLKTKKHPDFKDMLMGGSHIFLPNKREIKLHLGSLARGSRDEEHFIRNIKQTINHETFHYNTPAKFLIRKGKKRLTQEDMAMKFAGQR